MEQISLKAQKRENLTKGGLRQLRLSGRIPAVVYGKKHASAMLSVDVKELEKATSTHAGLNALFNLEIDKESPLTVLVRDYQAHPIHRDFTHVDFQAIDVSEKIVVDIPVVLIGLPEGVKEGGVLEQLLRKVEVRCLPTQIPNSVEINIEHLKIGDSVHVRELKIADGVEIMRAGDFAVATVVPPIKEEVVAPTPEEVAAAAAAPTAEGAAPAAEGAAAPVAKGAQVPGAAPKADAAAKDKGAAPAVDKGKKPEGKK